MIGFMEGDENNGSAQVKKYHPGSENLKLWQKGQSGNPKGRTAGSRNRKSVLQDWADMDADDGFEGTRLDQIARDQIARATQGDSSARDFVFDGLFGKLADKQEISGIDGAAIATEAKNINVNVAPATAEEAARAYADMCKKS